MDHQNHNMHDMAEHMPEPEVASTKGENRKYYPSVTATVEQLPELEGKKVGDRVVVMFEVEIKSVEKREVQGETRTDYRLEVQKGMVHEDVKPEEEEEESTGPLQKKKKISEMFKAGKKEEKEEEY